MVFRKFRKSDQDAQDLAQLHAAALEHFVFVPVLFVPLLVRFVLAFYDLHPVDHPQILALGDLGLSIRKARLRQRHR